MPCAQIAAGGELAGCVNGVVSGLSPSGALSNEKEGIGLDPRFVLVLCGGWIGACPCGGDGVYEVVVVGLWCGSPVGYGYGLEV